MYSTTLKNFRDIDVHIMRPRGFLERETEWARESYQKVVDGSGFTDVKNCPVCKGEIRSVLFSKFTIDICRCSACGHGYASQVPANVSDVYSDANYLDQSLEATNSEAEYRKKRFYDERVTLIKQFCDGNRLLDVGCGTGLFLEVAKKQGFEVYGQELGKGMAEWTRTTFSIPVWDEPVEQIDTGVRFDAITIFDVIEHVTDPVMFVLAVKRLLADNGVIIVLTPNLDSCALSIMKEKSQIVCPPSHLQYFTMASMKEMARRTDLALEYLVTNGIDLADMKAYYDLVHEDCLARACEHLYQMLQPVVDAANSGNHFKAVFRKNGQG